MTDSILTQFTQYAALLVGAGAVGLLAKSMVFTVRQQQVAIIERFGKFAGIAKPGLNLKLPYPVSKIANVVDLRIAQTNSTVEVLTQDQAFLKMPVTLQYQITDPVRATYAVAEPVAFLNSLVSNEVRAKSAEMDFNTIFKSRDAIKEAISESVDQKIEQCGIAIREVVVSQPMPSEELREACDKVIASQRLREAATNEAEANKIKIVGEATAKAEAMKLHGQGLADQRTAVAKGFQDSICLFEQSGVSADQALALMVITNGQETAAQAAKGPGAVIITTTSGDTLGQNLETITASMKALGTGSNRPKGTVPTPAASTPKPTA